MTWTCLRLELNGLSHISGETPLIWHIKICLHSCICPLFSQVWWHIPDNVIRVILTWAQKWHIEMTGDMTNEECKIQFFFGYSAVAGELCSPCSVLTCVFRLWIWHVLMFGIAEPHGRGHHLPNHDVHSHWNRHTDEWLYSQQVTHFFTHISCLFKWSN